MSEVQLGSRSTENLRMVAKFKHVELRFAADTKNRGGIDEGQIFSMIDAGDGAIRLSQRQPRMARIRGQMGSTCINY